MRRPHQWKSPVDREVLVELDPLLPFLTLVSEERNCFSKDLDTEQCFVP